MVHSPIITGAAIGFLVWSSFILVGLFTPGKFDIRQCAILLVFFTSVGACIGFLAA